LVPDFESLSLLNSVLDALVKKPTTIIVVQPTPNKKPKKDKKE